MKTGRPPKPTRLHIITGTYRPDRHGRRPDAPKPPADNTLTDGQRALLAAIPKDLSPAERQIYIDQTESAWWLRAIDHTALVAFAGACVRHRTASEELGKCLRDPAFANPTSATAQAGKAYARIADQAARQVLSWADVLGFSPQSRARLGIDADARPKGDDDPWAKLRLHPRDDPPSA
jgi:hypothetical protein